MLTYDWALTLAGGCGGTGRWAALPLLPFPVRVRSSPQDLKLMEQKGVRWSHFLLSPVLLHGLSLTFFPLDLGVSVVRKDAH